MTMLYQLNRPFQAHSIFFDVPSSPLLDILPIWFGAAWQKASPASRSSADPFLAIAPEEAHPLEQIQSFVYDHTTCREPYFVFHGGAVTQGDNAYLFLAATTTGKTTLITYLTQMGYDYLDDDCFYLHMDTLELFPYSSPIHLREGGLRYLQSVLPAPLPPCTSIDTSYLSRYVFLPERQTKQVTRPKKIFFLNRVTDPSVSDSCRPLTSFLALNKLFTSSLIPYHMDRRYIQFFQRLTPLCYELTYHDASFAAAQLQEDYHE